MGSEHDDLGESLFEISPSITIITNERSQIEKANPHALSELGYKAEELTGKLLSDIIKIPDKYQLGAKKTQLDCLISCAEDNVSVEILANDGRTFNSQVSISALKKAADGNHRHVICVHDNGELDRIEAEQDKYKNLMDAALAAIPDGFAVYDKDDRLLMFNKAYADVYWRSKPILKIGEKFENVLRYGLEAGQYLEAGDTKESHEVWLKERLRLHNNPTGPSIQNVGDRWLRVEERKLDNGGIVGIRADITQLIEAKSMAEMLGNVLDNMTAPMAFLNLDTLKFEYANKATLDKLLYTLEEFVELSPKDISVSAPEDEIKGYIQQTVENPGTVVSFRTVHQRKDGSTYPCMINSVYEVSGDLKRLICFIQDETEEQKMRAELEIQRVELQALVHSLPCFITHSEPDTTLKFVNDDYANFYNRKPEEAIGKKFVDFVPNVDKETIFARIGQLTEEEPIYTAHREGYHQDGTYYVLLWTNRMIYRDGKPYEIVSVGREVTAQRNSERKIKKQAHELELRNDALEQFAGIVSHDLRSPVRHIRMFGEMLMEDFNKGKTDNFETYIAKMREGALRMDRLILSLLEFSQVAYKQVNRSSFSFKQALDETKDNLAAEITDNKTKILVSGEESNLNLDYVLFVRLLENLIENSVKYSEGNTAPEILIECITGPQETVLTITDNGIGIPSEHADRIFNVFQRLHVDEKSYKGMGVGLALAKRIVDGHEGQIELDPDYIGGARFIIRFPLQK